MPSIAVDDIDNLDRSPLQRALHRPPYLDSLGVRPRRRERHVQDPILPYHFFICFAAEPTLAPLALEELQDELAAGAAAIVGCWTA